jgi:hypothetical protein
LEYRSLACASLLVLCCSYVQASPWVECFREGKQSACSQEKRRLQVELDALLMRQEREMPFNGTPGAGDKGLANAALRNGNEALAAFRDAACISSAQIDSGPQHSGINAEQCMVRWRSRNVEEFQLLLAAKAPGAICFVRGAWRSPEDEAVVSFDRNVGGDMAIMAQGAAIPDANFRLHPMNTGTNGGNSIVKFRQGREARLAVGHERCTFRWAEVNGLAGVRISAASSYVAPGAPPATAEVFVPFGNQ